MLIFDRSCMMINKTRNSKYSVFYHAHRDNTITTTKKLCSILEWKIERKQIIVYEINLWSNVKWSNLHTNLSPKIPTVTKKNGDCSFPNSLKYSVLHLVTERENYLSFIKTTNIFAIFCSVATIKQDCVWKSDLGWT